MWLLVYLFCPHSAFKSFPTVDHENTWGNTPKFISHHIHSLPRDFSNGVRSFFFHFSLWACWYPMSWYAAVVVTRSDEERDCIGMAALSCKSHLFLPSFFFPPLNLFFFLTPFFSLLSFIPRPLLCHCLYLPLFLFLTASSLPFTLSSLQEVLELAFSVLYESDEYLNFIAPDKHEVSQQ